MKKSIQKPGVGAAAPPVSEHNLSVMRDVIKSHISKSEILKNLKTDLNRATSSKPSHEALEQVEKAIDKHTDSERLTNQIIREINSKEMRSKARHKQEPYHLPIKKVSGRAIMLRIVQGTNFIDYLDSASDAYFIISLQFQRQRFSTVPIPASADPFFDSTFMLSINNEMQEKKLVDMHKLVHLHSPIHLVLLKRTRSSTTVVATKQIEWRYLLSNQRIQQNIELTSATPSKAKAKQTIGNLLIHLDLLPKPSGSQRLLHQHLIEQQLTLQERYQTQSIQNYIDYTTQWWKDFKNQVSAPQNRLVKLFVSTDDYGRNQYKPACSIITPIQSNYIETPFHAARFVSLIKYQKSIESITPAGLHERQEIWHHPHAFLSKMAGDVEDHAMLLCSLLLGFGLDAWICIGTTGEGAHAWVMTINNEAESKSSKLSKMHGGRKITFWESLTGQRLQSDDAKVHRFYRSIGCVFNNCRFYGNIQPDVRVFCTDFNLDDGKLWKPVDSERIKQVSPYVQLYNLRETAGGGINFIEQACNLQQELKQLVRKERLLEAKTDTKWDDKLGFMLTPALVNYEQVRLSGSEKGVFGNEQFQQAIKNVVPTGHTFKAFPIEFKQCYDTDRMFSQIVKNKAANDIITASGQSVMHAIRVKVVNFPQNVVAVWVMLAVRYRSRT